MQIGQVGTTSFSVYWIDRSGDSDIDFLHWMAIGPCE